MGSVVGGARLVGKGSRMGVAAPDKYGVVWEWIGILKRKKAEEGGRRYKKVYEGIKVGRGRGNG